MDDFMQGPALETFGIVWLRRWIFGYLSEIDVDSVFRVCKLWRADVSWVAPASSYIRAASVNRPVPRTDAEIAASRDTPNVRHARALWRYSAEHMPFTKELCITAASIGHTDVINAAVEAGELKKSYYNGVVEASIRSGCAKTVRLLLDVTGHEPAFIASWDCVNLPVLRVILDRTHADDEIVVCNNCHTFCTNDDVAALRELFSRLPRAKEFVNHMQLRVAVLHGRVGMVDLLLTQTRLDPAFNNNQCLTDACLVGNVAVFRRLLSDRRVNAAHQFSELLLTATICGRAEMVDMLLDTVNLPAGRFLNVDPTAQHNYAVYYAAVLGRSEVAKRLLHEPAVRARLAIDTASYDAVSGLDGAPSCRVALTPAAAVVVESGISLRAHKQILENHYVASSKPMIYAGVNDPEAVQKDRRLSEQLEKARLEIVASGWSSIGISATALPDVLCAAIVGDSPQLVEYLLSPEFSNLLTLRTLRGYASKLTSIFTRSVHTDEIACKLVRDVRFVATTHTVKSWIWGERSKPVLKMLVRPKIILGDLDVDALLLTACSNSLIPVVMYILEHCSGINVSADHNICAKMLAGHSDEAVLRALIKHPSFTIVSSESDSLLRDLCKKGTASDIVAVVIGLTSNYRLALTAEHSFQDAVDNYDVKIARSLLRAAIQGECEIPDDLQCRTLLVGLSRSGDTKTLEMFMDFIGVRLTHENFVFTVQSAAAADRQSLLQQLLADERLLPLSPEEALKLFRAAAYRRSCGVYKIIKADTRIFTLEVAVEFVNSSRAYLSNVAVELLHNPSVFARADIRRLATTIVENRDRNGLVNLLAVSEFNPAMDDNILFELACTMGDYDIAELLLRDTRVRAYDRRRMRQRYQTLGDNITLEFLTGIDAQETWMQKQQQTPPEQSTDKRQRSESTDDDDDVQLAQKRTRN